MNENSTADSFPPGKSATDSDSDPVTQAYHILVANEQASLAIDEEPLIRAARLILDDSKFTSAYVSIAVVDDPTIHSLNARHLGHDYPTDALSFVLEKSAHRLEGEIVVSSDTAVQTAEDAGWSPLDELMLYVIHGTLHLVGYDDADPKDQVDMYAAEARYLERMGVALPTDRSRWSGSRKESLP